MDLASLTEDDFEDFYWASRRAEEWLTQDGLPNIAGFDGWLKTVKPLDEMADLLYDKYALRALAELGEGGAEFCIWHDRLYADLIAVASVAGPLTGRFGFVNDVGQRYRRIPDDTFPSAHAATAHWVRRVGYLIFPEWNNAVDAEEVFPGPFVIASDEYREWLARQLQCVCWTGGRDAEILATRMEQERILLRERWISVKKDTGKGAARTTGKRAANGKPGRKPDPEKKKHADHANKLKAKGKEWKEIADAVNADFRLSGEDKHTAEQIRSLWKHFFPPEKKR